MPENYLQTIVERVTEIARKTAVNVNPVVQATVLSPNPDGSYNVDDGTGGCARVARLGNQLVQCGQTVMLGLEPQIGTVTNLCQQQVAVPPSTRPCPVERRIEEEEEEVVDGIFVDEDGNWYDSDGALLGENGPDTADIDPAYGYSFDAGDNSCWVGVTPTYDTLKIGDLDDDSGNQGEVYSSQATVLAHNPISDLLMGLELKNSGGGGHDDNWKLVLRDPVTFAIIAESSASNFLNDWINAHPTSFFGADPYTFSVHVSPDPEDGHFWVTPKSAVPPDKRPMFKVSSANLALLGTVELAVPDQFTIRAKRLLI